MTHSSRVNSRLRLAAFQRSTGGFAPRDLTSAELEKAFRHAFGDPFVRQLGSHRRLTTQTGGEHHPTIPNHDPLRPGTLRAILGEVMAHHRLFSHLDLSQRYCDEAVGFKANSQWLSAATPPDQRDRNRRHPGRGASRTSPFPAVNGELFLKNCTELV